MAFPFSIDGIVRIKATDPAAILIRRRIVEALKSETIERVELAADNIEFECCSHYVPRPSGNNWLFGPIDAGKIQVIDGVRTSINYRLSTTRSFRAVGFLSIALALPAVIWPWPWLGISTGSFVLFFVGNYTVVRFRLPFWLRKVAKSETVYVPRGLQLPSAD